MLLPADSSGGSVATRAGRCRAREIRFFLGGAG